MFKKIFIGFVALVLCWCLLLSSIAVSAFEDDHITAPAGILMEASTGKILYEKNSHQKRACASITKVMTLLLVMEALEANKIKLTDLLSASAHAASMGGSDIWLEEGEKMSVDDLIKATAVASANDAAVVLAEAISGSEEKFVDEMNKKAVKLGMNDTTFKNCNGLDEEGHLTSAYDVAVMSAQLIKYEKIFNYTSIWLDDLRGGKTQIVNTNKLLKTYDGINGLKTGTTGDAGCCMSATAERKGMTLVAVVLGCNNGTDRFSDAVKLLDYGFANYKTLSLQTPKKAKGFVKVKGGMVDKIKISCENGGVAVVDNGTNNKLETKVELKKDIEAPVKSGEILGQVKYYYGEKEIKSCRITAENEIIAMNFSIVMKEMYNSLISL